MEHFLTMTIWMESIHSRGTSLMLERKANIASYQHAPFYCLNACKNSSFLPFPPKVPPNWLKQTNHLQAIINIIQSGEVGIYSGGFFFLIQAQRAGYRQLVFDPPTHPTQNSLCCCCSSWIIKAISLVTSIKISCSQVTD